MIYGHLLPEEAKDSEFDIGNLSKYSSIQAIEAPYNWLATNLQVCREGLDKIFLSGQVVIKSPSDISSPHLQRATTIVVSYKILAAGKYAVDWNKSPTWRMLRQLPRLKHLILCDQWTSRPSEFVLPSFHQTGFPSLESITLRDLELEAKVQENKRWQMLRAERISRERWKSLKDLRERMEASNREMQTRLELRV